MNETVSVAERHRQETMWTRPGHKYRSYAFVWAANAVVVKGARGQADPLATSRPAGLFTFIPHGMGEPLREVLLRNSGKVTMLIMGDMICRGRHRVDENAATSLRSVRGPFASSTTLGPVIT